MKRTTATLIILVVTLMVASIASAQDLRIPGDNDGEQAILILVSPRIVRSSDFKPASDDGATQSAPEPYDPSQDYPGGGDTSVLELDLTCGDGQWIVTWEEDENGNPIDGTQNPECT